MAPGRMCHVVCGGERQRSLSLFSLLLLWSDRPFSVSRTRPFPSLVNSHTNLGATFFVCVFFINFLLLLFVLWPPTSLCVIPSQPQPGPTEKQQRILSLPPNLISLSQVSHL